MQVLKGHLNNVPPITDGNTTVRLVALGSVTGATIKSGPNINWS
jgi:hypothetical protein